jgi:Zn-dependent M28 family amino/carboxypeptidase
VRHTALAFAVALAAPAAAFSQPSLFLPDGRRQALVNEISGDRAYEHARHLSHFHRTAASRDFWKAAEYLRGAAEAAGLEDVRLIRQPWDGHGWSCRGGEAWLLDPAPLKLADYGEVAVSVADHSRTAHVTAELVDVGPGVAEKDYAGREVKGKVVLASGSLASVVREAVWKRGALGIVSSATNRPDAIDAPDQVAWGRLPYESKGVEGVADGLPPGFAIMISPRRGLSVSKLLATASKPLRVKIDVDTEYPEKPEQGMVEAWIRGTEIHDQQVVLTAHIQEEMTSANDDGSGCGNVLEIGRALARLLKDGTLPRPRRDIRFWWVNELSSQPQYFKDHPGEAKKMLVALNQDMVGARQSWGGRVQYGARLPWSLPHALEDVMESVLESVRDQNTSYLSNRGTGQPQPFLGEITAVKGSREPFHARMVPYFDSTDHHSFTPRHVGVPATSLTNWPDEFIHSTGDDLENIDATQLERNAVVVAAVALYFASLGDDELPALAGYVAARGRARIAADTATAVAYLARTAPEGRAAAWRDAWNLVRQSVAKEQAALGSLRRLANRSRAGELLASATRRLENELASELESLERAYSAMTGQNLPNVDLSPDERAMAEKVYVPLADPAAFEDALDELPRAHRGLHAMMRFEVYNFADGRRSAWEVYEAVAAEALSAGEWYYGRVTPQDVQAALDAAAAKGAFTVRKR